MPPDLSLTIEDLQSGRATPILETRKGTTVAATDVNIEREQVDPGYMEHFDSVTVFNSTSGNIEALIGVHDGVNFHVFKEQDTLATDNYLVYTGGFLVREGWRLRIQVKSAVADLIVTVYINGARIKL